MASRPHSTDVRRALPLLLATLALARAVHGWSAVASHGGVSPAVARHKNEISPYFDLALCPIRDEPWTCARQQSGRILDVWDSELHTQWQKLKVEADRNLNATLERRGYSYSAVPTKEKPSTILKKIEIGTSFMKEYLAETMDGFLGREYEYMQSSKNEQVAEPDDGAHAGREPDTDAEAEAEEDEDDEENTDTDVDEDGDEDDDEEEDSGDAEAENEAEADNDDDDESDDSGKGEAAAGDRNSAASGTGGPTAAGAGNGVVASNSVEFIEIEDPNKPGGQLKRPSLGGGDGGGIGKKKNRKKKKKGGQEHVGQPATVLVVQPLDTFGEHSEGHGGGGGGGHGGGGHGGRPLKQKQKRRKRKKHQQQQSAAADAHESSSSGHLDGLLEELADVDDLLPGIGGGDGGGKRKRKQHPSKYGRSNGATRGKKKKKKKALAKLVLLGSFLKAKIELLLKILGAHLQIKFFAIALIGLLINIARFWIDVKRGAAPQKVVYVEHAHHQHHYEDHADDWGGEQGSYWKRSLRTDPPIEVESGGGGVGGVGGGATDSYQTLSQAQPHYDAHNMAYRPLWQ